MIDRLRCLILVTVALSGCSGPGDEPVALGTLERDRLELIADARERILAVEVREGDRVVADQVLVRLDDSLAATQVRAAEANASAARHKLRELANGPRLDEILEARARLAGAQSALDDATREYERARELVSRQLVSQSAVDSQRAARDTAAAARKEAQAQLSLLLKGTRIEELDQARDALKQAEASLDQLRVTLQRLTVRAPRAGVIEALPYKLGERPPSGAPVVIMLADGETYARVYVPARLRLALQPGAAARVSVEGEAAAYEGRVRSIASEAAFTPYYALTQEDRGRLSYLADVTLTDPSASRLPAGVPVEVRPAAAKSPAAP